MKLLPTLDHKRYKQGFLASLPDVPASSVFTPDAPRDDAHTATPMLRYLHRQYLRPSDGYQEYGSKISIVCCFQRSHYPPQPSKLRPFVSSCSGATESWLPQVHYRIATSILSDFDCAVKWAALLRDVSSMAELKMLTELMYSHA